MTVTACAVLVFTLPLAVAVARIYRGGAVTRLQRDAFRAAADLSGRAARTPVHTPLRLTGLSPPSHGVAMAVYAPTGRRVYGSGPSASVVAGLARDGRLHQGVEHGRLAVSAPVLGDGTVRAVVRVWIPWDPIADSTVLAWLVLAALGAVVVALSALLAWRLARRVATPLERLTAAARALGGGDFAVQPERTGVCEADAVWRALAATAGRLGDLLERERRFSTAVSHQLRTPLTSLVLGLESAQFLDDEGRRLALETAVRRVEHLGDTIEDLLRLARETHRRTDCPEVATLLDRVAQRHRDAVHEAGRSLAVRCPADLPQLIASGAAVTQILDTLLDNALIHGGGTITLSAADVGVGVALEVSDEGPARADDLDATSRQDRRHGIGLPLARSLAEAEGGRLLPAAVGSRTVFSLLLPALETAPAGGLAVTGAKPPAAVYREPSS